MTCSLRKCKARQGNNTYRLYLAALRWRVCIKNPLISKSYDMLDEGETDQGNHQDSS